MDIKLVRYWGNFVRIFGNSYLRMVLDMLLLILLSAMNQIFLLGFTYVNSQKKSRKITVYEECRNQFWILMPESLA